MCSILALIALVWWIALTAIQDPTWSWLAVGIGTVVCLVSPGGLTCAFWLFLPEFRKQHRLNRRGGPPPGYSPVEPWRGSPLIENGLQEKTDYFLSNETILGSHSPEFQKRLSTVRRYITRTIRL
jgi:hypothetical protein